MSKNHTGPATEAPTMTRRARREAAGDTGLRFNAIPFLIAGVVVLLLLGAVFWWFVLREPDGGDEASWEWTENPVDGVHARDVPPEDWEAGWCLSGFQDEDTNADVVDCEQNYHAQVLERRNLSDGSYPGDPVVLDTAHQWCQQDVELSEAALAEVDYELQIQLWHPTESTWRSDGDRLVSCFLTRADGGLLSGDFLATGDEEVAHDLDVVEEEHEDEVDEDDATEENGTDDDSADEDGATDDEDENDDDAAEPDNED